MPPVVTITNSAPSPQGVGSELGFFPSTLQWALGDTVGEARQNRRIHRIWGTEKDFPPIFIPTFKDKYVRSLILLVLQIIVWERSFVSHQQWQSKIKWKRKRTWSLKVNAQKDGRYLLVCFSTMKCRMHSKIMKLCISKNPAALPQWCLHPAGLLSCRVICLLLCLAFSPWPRSPKYNHFFKATGSFTWHCMCFILSF